MSVSSTRTEDGPLKYKFAEPPLGFGGLSTVYAAKPVAKGLKATMSVWLVQFIRRKSPWGAWHKGFPLAVKVSDLNAENLKLTDAEKLECAINNINYEYLEGRVAKREELLREVEIMHQLLPNPHIVKLVDAFEFSPTEQFMLVMERMTTDLEDLTRKGAWNKHPDARINLLLQVIEALIHLKDKRIVHRDVKPRNILVSADGYAKLADFGIAEIMPESGKRKVTSRGGTLQYMAPELFIEGGEYDYAVDVWAFGWVIFSTYTRDSVTGFKKRFNDYHWKMWGNGELTYFFSILGGSYLSQSERDKIYATYRKESKVVTPAPDWMLELRKEEDIRKNEFFNSNQEEIQTLRSIFIPYPVEGPKGDIQPREGLSRRPDVEDLRMLPLFKSGQIVDSRERDSSVQQVMKEHVARRK